MPDARSAASAYLNDRVEEAATWLQTALAAGLSVASLHLAHLEYDGLEKCRGSGGKTQREDHRFIVHGQAGNVERGSALRRRARSRTSVVRFRARAQVSCDFCALRFLRPGATRRGCGSSRGRVRVAPGSVMDTSDILWIRSAQRFSQVMSNGAASRFTAQSLAKMHHACKCVRVYRSSRKASIAVAIPFCTHTHKRGACALRAVVYSSIV